MRKATHLALTLLIAVGLGVSAASAGAQDAAQKKSRPSKAAGSTHRKKSSKKAVSSRREKGQKAPTPERISEIQQALAKDGSFSSKPNGKWDDSTIEAMRKFQETHGLNATGKLDAKTLQQLGLGSGTAGVAAPMPPMSSSSMQKTPAAQTARSQP